MRIKKMSEDNSVFKYGKRTYYLKGRFLLVEIETVDDHIGESNLLLASDKTSTELQAGHPFGYVRAIGNSCWCDETEPRAEVGDRVSFKRYAGTTINRLKAGNLNTLEPELRTMQDYEISCRVEEDLEDYER